MVVWAFECCDSSVRESSNADASWLLRLVRRGDSSGRAVKGAVGNCERSWAEVFEFEGAD